MKGVSYITNFCVPQERWQSAYDFKSKASELNITTLKWIPYGQLLN